MGVCVLHVDTRATFTTCVRYVSRSGTVACEGSCGHTSSQNTTPPRPGGAGTVSMDMHWTIKQRDYTSESLPLPAAPAEKHPLSQVEQAAKKVEEAAAAPAEEKVDDPLSAAAYDPLSAAASDPLTAVSVDPLSGAPSDPLSSSNTFSTVGSVQLQGVGAVSTFGARSSRFLDWKERRAAILKQYAVAGHLRVNSDLLNVDGVATAALGSNLDEVARRATRRSSRSWTRRRAGVSSSSKPRVTTGATPSASRSRSSSRASRSSTRTFARRAAASAGATVVAVAVA